MKNKNIKLKECFGGWSCNGRMSTQCPFPPQVTTADLCRQEATDRPTHTGLPTNMSRQFNEGRKLLQQTVLDQLDIHMQGGKITLSSPHTQNVT